MITIKGYMGVALVVIGALLLIVGYALGWTSSNLVLLAGLIIIVLGAFVHVRTLKNGQKY